MSKAIIITDTHIGSRADSLIFHNYFAKFYDNIFFPYILEHDIKVVLHLGDMFDRRKYINYTSLQEAKKYFFDKIDEFYLDHYVKFYALVGNHDSSMRTHNDINSIDLIAKEYGKIHAYKNAEEIELDGCKILLVPWICTDNYDQTMKMIKNTKAKVCFGHLEIAGFNMYKDSISTTGIDRKIFEKFDIVASGHFHHKSQQDNIMYLGAPYEMTWSDYNDARGFHVFDTDTRTFEYIQNPYRMFHKVKYTDDPELLTKDYSYLKDSYVKVIIIEKNDPYNFDLFINKLEKVGLVDLQVVEDHKYLMLEDNNTIMEGVEDTPALLTKFIELTNQPQEQKDMLHVLLKQLYDEASE